MNDSHLFKIAKNVSENANYTGCTDVKIGCIVTYKGTILAKGFNTDKTHTRQSYYNKWRYTNNNTKYFPCKGHAELMALNKIKYLDIDFSKVHVYTYRERKNGELGLARPCPSCMALIKDMGVKNIHYTTDCGFAAERIVK